MKTAILLFGLGIFPFFLSAQFIENFSGDSLNNEIWQGDTLNFVINTAQELQLLDEDPVQSKSQLVAEIATGDSTNWTFFVRQEFSPSASNFAKIYLASTSQDLNASLNGYFIQIGGISGTADAIELYRQSGNDTELLISGRDSAVGSDPAIARIRVRRDNAGLWVLEADYTGGTNFESQGSAVDNIHPFGNYFGFVCTYSATRSDKFFFDDIAISPLFVDNRPPEVINLSTLDALHIDLLFDEPLAINSAEDAGNYALNNGIGISAASLDPANDALVHLTLADPLVSQQAYELTVQGVSDVNNNVQNGQMLPFTFFAIQAAQAYDILINEIFPDPSPVIGLPETEYLELHNRSGKIIDLENFILADNLAEIVLPSYLLFPGDFLIVYEAGTGDFSAFGDTLALPDLFALGNSNDELVLYNPAGDIVHAILYSNTWYQNSDKSGGGWSLEMINPDQPCTGIENWRASESTLGGTPGQENSIFSTNTAIEDLAISRVVPQFGGNRIQLFFNKTLDFARASDIDNYQIDGIPIINAVPDPVLYRSVMLQLGSNLQAATIYQLSAANSLSDCAGNSLEEPILINFGLPEPYGPKDVIINEILFNPESGGVDFVELYNRSDKIIDLVDLLIANRDDSLKIDRVAFFPTNYLLLPDQYVVLTPNVADIKMRYLTENPNAFVQMSLPPYADKAGSVVLFFNQNAETIFVDEFTYTQNYHNRLLEDLNGVSLERIFPDGITQDPANWHSAAQSVGFASPTYQNSQFSIPLAPSEQIISLPYSTFSPDNDGFRDFLPIQYQTPNSGYVANIRIFDTKGRLVKELSENEFLGTSGILQWDGTTSEGEKARIGIYLLWIELFNPQGDIQYFKENCVLAGQLN